MISFVTDWTPHQNAMLSNVQYYCGNKEEYFVSLWKDLTSKNKDNHIEIINEPQVPIYFTKPEFRTGGNLYMQKLDKLDQVMVKPSEIKKRIAQEIGPKGVQMYMRAIANHDWRAMKDLFKWPYSFGADYPPEMFYRFWWEENCHSDLTPYVKPVFSDIETDIINYRSDTIEEMVEHAVCPINAISVYYKHENDMHIYLMIPDGLLCPEELGKKQVASYIKIRDNWDAFMKKVHDIFDKSFGVIDYQFHWYQRKDELKMLIDYFALINKRRPDFVGFWNMSFDMPYMMQRCKVLGANPADVICDPTFPNQVLRFKKDMKHYEIKESGDFLYSSTVPQYICLMRNYAKHRKQTLYQSYSLDNISSIELGDHKIKYGEDGYTIRDVAYQDFEQFILYNIKDTLLTKQIDLVTEDCMYTWIVSHDNYTQLQDIFSPSLSLRNIVYYEFLQQAKGVY